MTTITIDEYGQIKIPLEANQELHLDNNDWLRVCIKSDHILIIPFNTELDEELIEAFVHEGILIDIK